MKKTRIDKLNNLFLRALNESVFSGAAMAYSKRVDNGFERFEKYYGLAQFTPFKEKLKNNSFFDLASLTKPLATVLILLALFEKGLLNSETQLQTLFQNCPTDKKNITIKQLMSHCAGFAAHRDYYKELLIIPKKIRKKTLVKRILDENMEYKNGTRHCYSDLGYMLLGFIIENVTGKKIGELAYNLIYKPIELHNDLSFPGFYKKEGYAYVSTEKCLWDKEMLSGTVHDDNCRVLGGQAGHAGLFGTIGGVVGLCEQLLDQWKNRCQHPAYSNYLLKETLKKVENSNWTMGFDTVSEKESSSGNFFSKESVGHLGFTGTSFWIDPEKDCIVVLLTNRVHYGKYNWKIKEFRPAFHDLLMG